MSHQAWLERPYQQHYSAGDEEQYLRDICIPQVLEEVVLSHHEECSRPEVDAYRDVEMNYSTWRQGGFGGWDANITVTCPECRVATRFDHSDDNIDL